MDKDVTRPPDDALQIYETIFSSCKFNTLSVEVLILPYWKTTENIP